ncbi:response regulator transcription factor [Thalassotalea sp. M1531]|uniref:Response regulator transcription factor n=1 Tax=Thalassotalea algicola TaxID=2716224 RepID=A0A7Y0LFZ9_9GAMM|nr:response regulator transcription factor [Thalassotalea algicola]NMP33562.1 response regulator transcription factor [Thalassotalea algicola]
MNKNTVLIIDDDVELTQLIEQYLSTNGYQVFAYHNGKHINEHIDLHQPDVIVLDLMLPDIDGLTICKNIRSSFNGAIVMLTALGDDIDEVTGLEVGADDYLAKPVKPRVLLAHLRAQIRRQTKIQQVTQESCIFCFEGKIKLDAGNRTVLNGNENVSLSSAEFDLLWLLAKQVGHIVKRETLHEKIFRLPYDGIDRSIDLRISRIRKKLGDDSKVPAIIKTVRNVGYQLAT